MFLRGVNKKSSNEILNSLHGSIEKSDHVGGNFVVKAIIQKIFRIGYYWKTIFNDTSKFVRESNGC